MKDVKDEIVALKKKIDILEEKVAKAEKKRDRYEEEGGIKSDEYKDAKEEVLRLSQLLHDTNTTYNTLLSQQQQQQQPPSQGTSPSFLFPSLSPPCSTSPRPTTACVLG